MLVVVLLAGGVGARIGFQMHVRRVTGLSELPEVSCLYCHRGVSVPRVAARNPVGPRYLSPAGMVVSPDAKTLFVAAAEAGQLLEIDLSQRKIIQSLETPGRPHGVAISADGRRIAVSHTDDDAVLLLDARSLEVLHTLPTGSAPAGLALSGTGSRLYVANGASDDLLIASTEDDTESFHLVTGHDPYALALSKDGQLLAVANRLAGPVPPRTLPVSELTLVDPQRGRVLERRRLESAHLSEGVAIASDGSFVLATISRIRNLLPLTQVARGAVMNSAIAFIETRRDGRTVQFPLSEVNAYFADASDVVLTPDDRVAFISHGGANTVTAVDVGVLRGIVAGGDASVLDALADDMGASLEYVIARIPTRDNPRSLAISPDGRRVYVAERLADSIAVIDTERLEVVERIDLGGPQELTAERRGERLFYNAAITFQGQFSCRSCHPDGHSDGLIWDFDIDGVGENLLDTRSLRGIRDTAPFKWNGKNPDLPTQCGPRFARVLMRSDPFTPQQLEDLVAYIESLALPPVRSPEALTETVERGYEIFHRTWTNSGEEIPVASQCVTCHRPPLFTNRLMTDVGTGGAFDTPHLFGARSSAPYLHDGRALTLEEIWTVHSPDDTHGVTNDLTKVQLNQLMIYLRSI